MILPALEHGGYAHDKQQVLGNRPGGRVQKVDAIAHDSGERIAISLKWQQTSGTAEQKVPFEVMCLADAVREGLVNRAYLVLGGDGWTLREYFVSGALRDHLIHSEVVKVVTLEAFIRLANSHLL